MPDMSKFSRLPSLPSPFAVIRALLSLAALCLLLPLAGCSQNEYSWDGPKPPAPKNPRNAHVIQKEGAGMNTVGSMEEAPAASQGGSVFRGTATLSREAEGMVKPGATLFVIARSLDGHPTPVAAAKFRVEKFPVDFVLTPADAMDGAQLPAQVDILLRLDDDGDLTTKHPGDMASRAVTATSGEHFSVLLAPPESK
jgi:hypothetical protein